jgi:hypothetical protein
MMVKPFNTPIANATMAGSVGAHYFAIRAQQNRVELFE